jgi:hypothetical protein
MVVTRFSLAAAMILSGTAWGQTDSLPNQIPPENVGKVNIPGRGAEDFVDSMGIKQQGVSQLASAVYLPTAFLSGFRLGVARTFSYDLIDEVNDPHLASWSGPHP